MTYDDWKAREDAFEVDPNRCGTCNHPENHCDCLCCNEPPMLECDKCGAQAGYLMVASGYRGGPCECGGNVRER